MKNQLDIYIATSVNQLSLNPLDSDSSVNAIVVEQLVGTLVRMHPSGRYEGYLAESWSTSSDFLKWNFKIKSGLFCEDGSPITGETFVKSFNSVIKLFKKHSELPLIDRLEGFDQLDALGYVPGIEGKDQTLSLKFSKPVTAGLLEYLALPFLGFFCENNFNQDGSWKNNSFILSSASYQLDNWSGNGPVILKLRNNWPTIAKNPPEKLQIELREMKEISPPKERGFIYSFLLEEKSIPTNYQVVKMLPTVFNGIIISPFHNDWLANAVNRQKIRDAIKLAQQQVELKIASANVVDTFYPHMSQKLDQKIEIPQVVGQIKKPLIIAAGKKLSPQREYQLAVIIRALTELQLPYEIKIMEAGNTNMMNDSRNHQNYDFRLVGVNIGGGIENQLVKFMFCSKLGVSFSDSSGRMCKLVNEYESKYGDVVPEDALIDYINRFDQYVFEDATVVPLIKTGHAWLLTPDLPLDNISPTMDTPYFDLFNL